MWIPLSVCPFVLSHGTTWLPLKGFLWIFIAGGTDISRKFKFCKIVVKITGILRVDLLTIMTNLATNISTAYFLCHGHPGY